MTETMILKKYSYREMVESLTKVLAESFEDFPSEQECFQKAISVLSGEPEGAVPSAGDLVNAIDRQIGSGLLFSFFLGLKANWDHFTDPDGSTFLDTDPEAYLQEEAAKQLPDCQSAELVRKQFYSSLSPEQKTLYEDIIAYICYLETVGPKLAHYRGYLLGNRLFPRIVPGYREDSLLTARYRSDLEAYFGVSI